MNIVFVGLSGVPYKRRACDLRILSFASAFITKGHSVSILNRRPISSKSLRTNEKVNEANLEIIELFEGEKPHNLFLKTINVLHSTIKELKWLINRNRIDNIDVLHLYTGHYFDFVFYFLISKLIHSKIIYQYVEIRSSHKRGSLYHKLNGLLCDNFGYLLFDGVITISSYIDNHVKSKNPNFKTIKIPPICKDFSFSNSKIVNTQPYLMFCGSAEYFDIIKLIIDSYQISNVSNNYKLLLVLSGTETAMNKVKKYFRSNVEILSDLPYSELLNKYHEAAALLIPLSNAIQDIARFPNKICEYTSCKGLIITTNYGEIPVFFTDGVNALIATDFNYSAIASKLDEFAKMNNDQKSAMKDKAYEVYKSNFEISIYSILLDEFLTSLFSNE